MKYISRWAALLLAVMMTITSAGAELSLDGLTQTQLDALYQTAAETEIAAEDVLGATAELWSADIQTWADNGYGLQWYVMDDTGAITALEGQNAVSLDITYTLAPQRFVCIAMDSTGKEYISPTFVAQAQTSDMEGYLNYLYEPQFWNEDGTPNARAIYNHLNTVWNVDMDGVSLARSVVEAWWAERREAWFDYQLLCSCVITGAAEADFCMLHPYAEHVGTCGWYTMVDVVEDEATGITVSGDLPAGVSLQVTAATGKMPEIDTRHFDPLHNYPIITGYSISLENSDGSEYIVPKGTNVLVNIPNAWLFDMEYPVVDVYHVKDSGEVVYLTSQFGEVVLLEDGSASFETDGFSEFWVTTGEGSLNVWDGIFHVYYLWPTASITTSNWFPYAQITLTNETSFAAKLEKKRADGWDYTLTISVAEDAKVGDRTSVEFVWNNGSNVAKFDVVVCSDEYVEELQYLNKFYNTGNPYPIQIAIRDDGELPGEPAYFKSAGYVFFAKDENGNYYDGDDKLHFAPHAYDSAGNRYIIDPYIRYHADWEPIAVDGSQTIGLIDATGVEIKKMIDTSYVDWDKLLEAAAKTGKIKASDGTTLTTQNMKEFILIPYVIKCQEPNAEGRGWHIDCAVVHTVDKRVVYLTYDINFPDGMTLTTKEVGLPNNQVGGVPSTFDVGAITGLINNTVKVSEIYDFTFLGWNIAPDGSGDWYYPDDSITITEDTTLYAIWSITPEIGTGSLRVRKVVQDDNATGNETFTFSISIPDANEDGYDYTLYGADNVAVKGDDEKPVTGKVKNGDTLTLKNGQYVIIKSLPISKDGKVITVTETEPGEYAPSWSGGTANGAAVNVEIKDGRLSEVTCTNSKAGSTTTLTVKKTGLRAGESAIIKVEVDGKTYMLSLSNTHDSDTIVNLSVGAKYTVTELNAWTWQYAENSQPVTGNTVAGGSTVTITNTQKTGNWMHDESSVINDLGTDDADKRQTPINNQ